MSVDRRSVYLRRGANSLSNAHALATKEVALNVVN